MFWYIATGVIIVVLSFVLIITVSEDIKQGKDTRDSQSGEEP